MAMIKLADGQEFHGTPYEVQQFLEGGAKLPMSELVYYHSTSKGWIRYSDMATAHIGNAILKIYRDWVIGFKLAQFDNPGKMLSMLAQGPVGVRFLDGLLTELHHRRYKSGWGD